MVVALLRLPSLLFRQIVDDIDGILGDALDGLPVETTAQPVLLGKAKGRQDDRIIKFVDGLLLLQVLLGELGRLVRVARQQALVELDVGASAGSSPSSTSKKPSWGTWRPSTTRQTVSGVDRSSPTGPHSVVQTTAATRTAIGESPVLEPYSHGSSTLLLNSSRLTNSAMVSSGGVHPGATANDRAMGNSAASTGPM